MDENDQDVLNESVNQSLNNSRMNTPRSIKSPSGSSTPINSSSSRTFSQNSPAVLTPINEESFENFQTPFLSQPPVVNERPRKSVRRPLRYDEYETDLSAHAAYSCSLDVPVCFNDVADRPDESEWQDAIADEIKSLEENKTWKIVEKPKDAKLLGTRWIFKIKT